MTGAKPLRPGEITGGGRARGVGALPLPLLVGSWVLLNAAIAVGQSPSRDTELVHRFQSEAPLAWEHYRAFATRLQGQGVQRLYDLTKDRAELPGHMDVTFRQGPSWAVLSGYDGRGSKPKFAGTGVNTKYVFEIEGESEAALKITKLSLVPSAPPSSHDPLSALTSGIGGTWTCLNLRLPSKWLPDLIREQGFKLKRVSADPSLAHPEAVLVEYDYVPPRKPSIRGGVFRVDPSREWVLLDYRVNYQSKNGKSLFTCRFEYADDISSPPVLRRCVEECISLERLDGSPPIHREKVVELDMWFQDDVAETECTLSAFGLPEPSGITWETGRGRVFWILGAGLFLSFGAGLLYWLSRRSQASA